MAIGSPGLTATSDEQKLTEEGMAYFAGTGPSDKTCGDCVFRGYSKTSSRETFNARTNEWYTKTYRVSGCQKFFKLTGRHGGGYPSQQFGLQVFRAQGLAAGC